MVSNPLVSCQCYAMSQIIAAVDWALFVVSMKIASGPNTRVRAFDAAKGLDSNANGSSRL